MKKYEENVNFDKKDFYFLKICVIIIIMAVNMENVCYTFNKNEKPLRKVHKTGGNYHD